jgi:hypothetical protein
VKEDRVEGTALPQEAPGVGDDELHPVAETLRGRRAPRLLDRRRARVDAGHSGDEPVRDEAPLEMAQPAGRSRTSGWFIHSSSQAWLRRSHQ